MSAKQRSPICLTDLDRATLKAAYLEQTPASIAKGANSMEWYSTNSNRAGVVLGTPPVDQFPRTMTVSSTASAATDALPLAPVEGAKNERIMGRLLGKSEILDVACWNVRTLLDEGSQKITMSSLLKYGVDIACLSEVRLPNNGRQTIMVPQSDAKYHLYHKRPG